MSAKIFDQSQFICDFNINIDHPRIGPQMPCNVAEIISQYSYLLPKNFKTTPCSLGRHCYHAVCSFAHNESVNKAALQALRCTPPPSNNKHYLPEPPEMERTASELWEDLNELFALEQGRHRLAHHLPKDN